MNQAKKLKEYCVSRLLEFEIEGNGYLILKGEKEYYIVNQDAQIVNEDNEFLPTCVNEVDGFVFEFGGRWYLQDSDEEELQLNELNYYCSAKQVVPTQAFLGIRSGFELMNGMGLYKDWIKKAKFLNVEALGICEKSTLSGVLSFQKECSSAGIKSIIGMTIPVKGDKLFDVKLYVKDFQGWLSLLKFNSAINIDKENSISLEALKNGLDGLYLIVDPKSTEYHEAEDLGELVDYYQLDTVTFLNEEKDVWFVNNLERFIKGSIQPIAITDAFYLEKEDYLTREALWTVAKAFDDRTDNQYFKSEGEYVKELFAMFDDNDSSWMDLYKEASANRSALVDGCNFKYDVDTRHLPKYVKTEVEQKQFATNAALFLHLIKKGFEDRKITEPQAYIDRVKKEIEILKMGDTIDYFLILHDIVRHAKSRDMLTGIGRGSAGGSLVAYLLGIIHVDPLEFDLLFERFLNAGRMGRFEDRPFYTFEDDKGNSVELAEGDLARVIRDGKEMPVYCHDIIEGDEIIKY